MLLLNILCLGLIILKLQIEEGDFSSFRLSFWNLFRLTCRWQDRVFMSYFIFVGFFSIQAEDSLFKLKVEYDPLDLHWTWSKCRYNLMCSYYTCTDPDQSEGLTWLVVCKHYSICFCAVYVLWICVVLRLTYTCKYPQFIHRETKCTTSAYWYSWHLDLWAPRL